MFSVENQSWSSPSPEPGNPAAPRWLPSGVTSSAELSGAVALGSGCGRIRSLWSCRLKRDKWLGGRRRRTVPLQRREDTETTGRRRCYSLHTILSETRLPEGHAAPVPHGGWCSQSGTCLFIRRRSEHVSVVSPDRFYRSLARLVGCVGFSGVMSPFDCVYGFFFSF